jgi:glutathione peroxidase
MDHASLYEFKVKNSAGLDADLSQYKGKVVLVVNVASQCGFTPQYEGLEALYNKYKNQGLVIIGFPSNQFGSQEPGTDDQIQEFCKLNFGVTFPVMAKIDVNGSNTAPVYDFLKSSAPGFLGTEVIKWNFTKFLIGKNGRVIKRFAPTTKPEEISADIEKALKN